MQYISEKFLLDGTFFHCSFSLLLIFNPRVSARYFRFFVYVKCRYKIKLFTKNRSNLDKISFFSIKFHQGGINKFLYRTSLISLSVL